MKQFIVSFVFALFFCNAVSYASNTQPNQVHLSLTGRKDEMVVMWATYDETQYSVVQYWTSNSDVLNATGSWSHYYFPVDLYESPALHVVILKGLQLDTEYSYKAGSPTEGWSDVFTFRTEPEVLPTPSRPLKFAMIGDHGTTSDSLQVLNGLLLEQKTSQQPFNLLLHAGDISYANGVQKYWDIWGNLVEPFAAHVPWMAGVGNHEAIDLFVAYEWRFRMPHEESNGTEGDLFFSFDYGNVHFVAVSSEMFFYEHWLAQYAWLEEDFKKVDRKVTPWIITYWHTPWYCSNKHHYQAGADMLASYEELIYKYKIDLVLNGHVHAYERTLPVYKGQITQDAPIYITNGAGGNNEGLATGWYDNPSPAWSAAHEGSYWGFGVAEVYNSTHLNWKFHRSIDNQVVDEVMIVRERS